MATILHQKIGKETPTTTTTSPEIADEVGRTIFSSLSKESYPVSAEVSFWPACPLAFVTSFAPLLAW